MSLLALDLSKRSTGWAFWKQGMPAPIYGSVSLGSEYSNLGSVCAKCFREVVGVVKVAGADRIVLEKPFNAAQLKGSTNADTLTLQAGLATAVHMAAHHAGVPKPHEVSPSSWRKNFIGPQKRGTKRPTLKKLAIERCRQFGWSPKNDDEADALGILDSTLLDRKIQTPWRTAETLQPMSEVR